VLKLVGEGDRRQIHAERGLQGDQGLLGAAVHHRVHLDGVRPLGLVTELVVARDSACLVLLARDAEPLLDVAEQIGRHAEVLRLPQRGDVVQARLHRHVHLRAAEHLAARLAHAPPPGNRSSLPRKERAWRSHWRSSSSPEDLVVARHRCPRR
jgi:hypothetical protein